MCFLPLPLLKLDVTACCDARATFSSVLACRKTHSDTSSNPDSPFVVRVVEIWHLQCDEITAYFLSSSAAPLIPCWCRAVHHWGLVPSSSCKRSIKNLINGTFVTWTKRCNWAIWRIHVYVLAIFFKIISCKTYNIHWKIKSIPSCKTKGISSTTLAIPKSTNKSHHCILKKAELHNNFQAGENQIYLFYSFFLFLTPSCLLLRTPRPVYGQVTLMETKKIFWWRVWRGISNSLSFLNHHK